jgi:hypothetical protein
MEGNVSRVLQKNFSFVVFRVDAARERLSIESKLISTVSHCTDCIPSPAWLWLHSPKQRIRETGLWLVNELFKEPLSLADLQRLETLLM